MTAWTGRLYMNDVIKGQVHPHGYGTWNECRRSLLGTRKSREAVTDLAADAEQNGIAEPVIVTVSEDTGDMFVEEENDLIRMLIAMELGLPWVPYQWHWSAREQLAWDKLYPPIRWEIGRPR